MSGVEAGLVLRRELLKAPYLTGVVLEEDVLIPEVVLPPV